MGVNANHGLFESVRTPNEWCEFVGRTFAFYVCTPLITFGVQHENAYTAVRPWL